MASTFYVIGGILTLKFLKNKGNENVTTSTILWSLIFLLPFLFIPRTMEEFKSINGVNNCTNLFRNIFQQELHGYLRFHILTKVGMVFQTQVAYLIPIFGVIFGYIIMDEQITWKVLASLIIIISGIYMVKRGNKGIKKIIMMNESVLIKFSFYNFIISFFIFYI